MFRKQSTELTYKRVLLKMSGEALRGSEPSGIDPSVLEGLAEDLKSMVDLGVQLGLVIGGGNLFRGVMLNEMGLGRMTGDYIGMMSTVMNALAMRDVFERFGMKVRLMSALPISGLIEVFDRRRAINALEQGEVVIFAGGTGNPLVTTDSAASLRAVEIEADVLLKATQVDGVYDKDPRKNQDATIYTRVSYDEALKKELGVMDLAAFCQCRDQALPIVVFNVQKTDQLCRLVQGESLGTFIDGDIPS